MKTERIPRTRTVPHTVDGETEYIEETEYDEAPAAPRDWDQIARIAVTVMAVVLLLAAVSWSTASIGSLLSRITVAAAAYSAASAFDLLWIMATVARWLLRTDPVRVQAAIRFGRVALAVAMAAIIADGYASGELVIGAVGACVSALAKGGTELAMLVHDKPLDPRTQQWLNKRRARLNAQLGLLPVRRELARGEAALSAERRRLELLSADSGSADPDRSEESTGDPDPNVVPLNGGAATTKDLVRIAWDSGIRDDDAVIRYIKGRTRKAPSPDTVGRYLRLLRSGVAG
ncbi:protein transporter Sec31 [Streptomyces naphthomycinicus]|uniref:protein transporter Sec31 n=1 Tax=Streptomyces naphthomycinicus TaxID=2872625 RepID=UPI001CEC15EC|nr:protein transporter Sec31 [Streptomyces sp. TML10]